MRAVVSLADSDTGVCHKHNTLPVLDAQNRNSYGSHKIKSFSISITLTDLSNYRASTTADTCNLTDLVRVAQQ